MYNQRYIEITSSYRNRNRYPNPAHFLVELALTGQATNSLNSKDAVFDSATIYPPPNISSPNTYSNTGYVFGPTINGGQDPSEYIVSVLPVLRNSQYDFSPIPLSELLNVYNGNTFQLVEKTGAPVTSNEFRTIIDYKISENQQIVTVPVDGTAIRSTDIALTTACDIENFFVGMTVEFVSTADADLLGVTRTIEYYRAVDSRIYFSEPIEGVTITVGDEVSIKTTSYQLTLDSPLSVGALPELDGSCQITNNTTYRIRGGRSSFQGTLVAGTRTTFTLPAGVGSVDYTGYTLWITSDPIVAADTLDATTIDTFTLPAIFANVFPDDSLNNMEITITSGAFVNTTYTIRDWVNATLTGTIEPQWNTVGSPALGDTFEITQPNPSHYRLIHSYNPVTRVGSVTKSFSYTNLVGTTTTYEVGAADTFELMQFTRDNYHQLEYTNSVTAQQQEVCYEIKLTSLTLPTSPLVTGGTILTNYPYVYIEFNSIRNGSTPNQIYSNNPNAHNMMFRAPIVYNNLETQDFITLDGHDMTQTLKFSPNDAFLFSVYLPDGQLFQTDTDFMSPSDPDPKKQITVCFSMRRL